MDYSRGHSIYTINNTIGVATVVYCGYQALSIPPSIIKELKARADIDGKIPTGKEKEPPFPGKVGDKIKFIAGNPFAGFIAEIQRVDTGGKLMVVLDQMLGAERSMTIDRADVGQIIPKDDCSRPLEPIPLETHFPAIGGSPSGRNH